MLTKRILNSSQNSSLEEFLNVYFFIFTIKGEGKKRKMPEEIGMGIDFTSSLLAEFNTKLRDIEEKQKLLKERVLLIGQNLVEGKEDLEKQVTKLKLDVEELKEENRKIKSSLLRLTEELEKRARTSELEMLNRQFKMFEPLTKK